MWVGTARNPSGELVAFKLDIRREQDRLSAALVNGDERIPATEALITGNQLSLRFNFYDAELIEAIEGDDLRGSFSLGFEYTGDSRRDAQQLRIFSARHGISYPVLLAGTTEEGDAQRKMPQLVNFGAYPTTIYIGRDGLVKHIHAGFEGRATGERFTKLKAEMDEMIKNMLDSKDPHREIVE